MGWGCRFKTINEKIELYLELEPEPYMEIWDMFGLNSGVCKEWFKEKFSF